MQRQSAFFILLTFIVLVALAAVLRFYHLGTRSFDGDEIVTQIEAGLYFENSPLSDAAKKHSAYDSDLTKSQFYRLPQMICASHFVHWIAYRLFGSGEFGSRVLMAVMGSLSAGLAFLLGRSLFGFSGSLILALLICFFPMHIEFSQYSRFNIQAFFCFEIVFLLGGHVAVNRSVWSAFGLGPVAVIMVLSHSFGIIIWGILLLGLLADFLFAKRMDIHQMGFPWKIAVILGFWSMILILIAVVHIIPLAQSWNTYVTWGETPVSAVLKFIADFGWAAFLLSLLAWVYVLFQIREPGQGYWAFCTFASGIAVFLLPLKIAYNPWYNFLFTFPLLVMLALFVDFIRHLMVKSDFQYAKCCSILWIGAVMCFNLPVLKGYYKDGERYDMRSACQYIQQNGKPDDQIVCNFETFCLMINKYIPEMDVPIILLPESKQKKALQLQQIFDKMKMEGRQGRIWIMVDRSEFFRMSKEMRQWLDKNAEYQASFGNERYDRSPLYLEVFIVPSAHTQ